MTQEEFNPRIIHIEEFLSWKDRPVKSIDGINIPNITIPSHLFSKKRATETSETLSISIRFLFNSLTAENVTEIKKNLREIVFAKAQTIDALKEVAEEILQNFIINETNIKNYMQLLNAVFNASILVAGTSEKPITIGNCFLNKCREKIFSLIEEKHVRNIADMDLDDNDQLDLYNREREKISNLIITICCLYEQRNSPSSIKLNSGSVYAVMKTIFDVYDKNQKQMAVLGNPYEGDCSDEDEYVILRKMCTLYAEQLYIFMEQQGKEFVKDQTIIKDRMVPGDHKLAVLVDRFKLSIIPTLTESYIISKCQSLKNEL